MKEKTHREATRRETLRLLGAAGVVALAGCGSEADAGGIGSGSGGNGGNAGGGTGGGDPLDRDGGAGGSSAGGSGAGGQADSGAGGTAANGAGGAGGTAGDTSGTGGAADGDMGGDGATGGAGGGAPQCVLRPAQTLGPFPNLQNKSLTRADIRESQQGAALHLTLRVYTASACAPVPDAVVEVWQCNATGAYSEYQDFGTADQNWLRGNLTTGADGTATFVTIYPGWYPGRAVHIHFRIFAGSKTFVSQLYFDDALTDEVHKLAPYAAHQGQRTSNQGDGIFNGDSELILDVVQQGGEYAATFDVGLG